MNARDNQPRINGKSTLVIFIVAISVLIVVNYSLPFLLGGTREHQQQDKITITNVTITVHYKNDTTEQRTNVSSYTADATVFEFMTATFQITYNTFPSGYFISAINGASFGWTYIVNEESPGIACNLYGVSNNSIIAWNQA